MNQLEQTVVEASAGCGKTYALEEKAVELIGRGFALEQLLIVTFTEKAARSLQTRLRERLSAASFQGATICTIHAFCMRVLQNNAFFSRRLFDHQVVDARGAFARAFKRALERTLAKEPDFKSFLRRWLEQRSLEALESLLFECRTRRGQLYPALSLERVNKAIALLFSLDLRPHSLRPTLKRTRLHPKVQASILERLLSLRRMLIEHQKHPDLASFIAALSSDKPLAYVRDRLREHRGPGRRLQDIEEALSALLSATPSFESAIAQRFGPVIEDELAKDKAKQGQLDFEDMLSMLKESLDGPFGDQLRASIRARYRYALIDEFQDTDEIQWSIFERLFLNAEDFGGGLYIIGDPKQAIYNFRGADVHTYLRARKALLGAGNLGHLQKNYRASAPMIEALNRLLREDFFTGDIRYDHPVVPGRPDFLGLTQAGERRCPVHLFELDETSGHLEALGRRIAQEIKTLQKDAALLEGDRSTPLRSEDIFVLVRTGEEARKMAEHLRAEGVAFQQQERLFETREAKSLLTVLQAVLHPEKRSARMQAWLTPFFGVPLERLPDVRTLEGPHPLIDQLFAWRALPLHRLFTALLEDSGLRERALLYNPRSLDTYREILERLQEMNASSLETLIEQLKGWIDQRALEIPKRSKERAAVQIMTMHKAKGLEAAVVFLYGGFSSPKTQTHLFHEEGKRLIHVGAHPPQSALKEHAEEDQRLLYVAMTRAKARLYLPLPSRAPDGLYAPLWRALSTAELPDALFSRELVKTVPINVSDTSPLESWTPPKELLQPPQGKAPQPQDPRVLMTSYTKMKKQQGGYKPPATDFGAKADVLGAGAAVGRYLHQLLATLPLEHGLEFEAFKTRFRPDFQRALLEHGLPDALLCPSIQDEDPDVFQLVYRALAGPLTLGDLHLAAGVAQAETTARQLRFLYPLPTLNQRQEGLIRSPGFIEGMIDLVLEHQGRVYIIDWKSDRLERYDPETLEPHVATNYLLQAEFYSLAIKRMYRFKDEAEFERRFGGVAFIFIRGLEDGGVHFSRPSWRQVLESQVRLLPKEETL